MGRDQVDTLLPSKDVDAEGNQVDTLLPSKDVDAEGNLSKLLDFKDNPHHGEFYRMTMISKGLATELQHKPKPQQAEARMQVVKPVPQVDTPNDNRTSITNRKLTYLEVATGIESSQDDDTIQHKLSGEVVTTQYGELHQLASEEPTDIKAKACVQTATQQAKQQKIEVESKIDRPSNGLIVTCHLPSTAPDHKCFKPIDQGTHTTHKNITNSNDCIINDSFTAYDDLVTIQHGLAIATNTQLAHTEDERSVSSSLQTEPILDPADVSKSNISIDTFGTKPTLDDTFDSLETFDSTIIFEGSKGTKLPMPPELERINRDMDNPLDIDLNHAVVNVQPKFDTIEPHEDPTTSHIQVDISNSIKSIAALIESALDDTLIFIRTFDCVPSTEGSCEHHPQPACKPPDSPECNMIDPFGIDPEHVMPYGPSTFKASDIYKHPPIVLVPMSAPSKSSEEDGERPHKAREQNGEQSRTIPPSKSHCEDDQSTWTNTARKNLSSAVKSREHDWERLRRQFAWLPKLVTQKATNYCKQIQINVLDGCDGHQHMMMKVDLDQSATSLAIDDLNINHVEHHPELNRPSNRLMADANISWTHHPRSKFE